MGTKGKTRNACVQKTKKNKSKKESISTANILKRQPTRGDELYLGFKDKIDNTRTSIREKSMTSLQISHDKMLERIEEQHTLNQAVIASSSHVFAQLSSALAEETVESTFTRDGETFREVVKLGVRVCAFQELVDRKRAAIRADWDEWKKIQEVLLALGADVLGTETSDTAIYHTSFQREQDLVSGEHLRLTGELQEDIASASRDVLVKMDNVERDLDAELRKDKSKIIAALLRD